MDAFTTKAQADTFTRDFNKLLDWAERSVELIAQMAASAYQEQIWQWYDDCDSWASYVVNHLRTNRIKLSVSERRAVVVQLYQEHDMTQQDVADVLGVSQRTISDDLGVSNITNPHPERGGRPRTRTPQPSDIAPPPVIRWAHRAVRLDINDVIGYAEHDPAFREFLVMLIKAATERGVLA